MQGEKNPDAVYQTTTYMDYQDCYREEMRESDKKLLSIIEEKFLKISSPGYRILDLGCSNGNLLWHLKKRYPDAHLVGADLFPGVIKRCKEDPSLEGISFCEMDVMALDETLGFDLVIANALLFAFNYEEFLSILKRLKKIISPNGGMITFDWYHPFDQSLSIVESSTQHPEGLQLYMRSFKETKEAFLEAEFDEPSFYPFKIPIPLELDEDFDLITHTRETKDGEFLQFRGALHQPWCHMVLKL